VAAALEGGLVANAVNVPALSPEELEAVGPFLPLASKLGELAVELSRGAVTRLDLAYVGELAERDTRLVTVAALNGAFQGRVEQHVNYVNAPLVARERGIEVSEERRAASRDFTSLVEVRARTDAEEVVVAGTVIGREHHPRLVSALGFEVEIELEPLMLFIVNEDRPGMIGRVGTLMGQAGINIANMGVARNQSTALALMVLSTDEAVPAALLEALRAEPGFVEARSIVLDGP
jgi:D-3-phosphoglycerate dehydrogenase